MKKRVSLVVTGRVQGVNFRRHAQHTAQKLGVRGWVRNLPDGGVEGCFEGEAAAVESLVEWCRRGPALARVDSLTVREESFTGELSEFLIRY
jgi:acylphosphatase